MTSSDTDSEQKGERFRIKLDVQIAAVPGSVLLANKMPYSVRVLASVILLFQGTGEPPGREDLAAAMGVDTRTIDRWIDVLRDQQLIETLRDGKRNVFGFMEPRKGQTTKRIDSASPKKRTRKPSVMSNHDRMIEVGAPTDRSIIDHPIIDHPIDSKPRKASRRRINGKLDRMIDSAPVGGVGGAHDLNEDREPTTSTPRGPLKTRHAKHMLRLGIMAAPEFDTEEYDSDAFIVAIDHMRREGLRHDQIVYRLRLDPPSFGDPYWQGIADALKAGEQQPAPDEPAVGLVANDLAGLVADESGGMDLERLWARMLGDLQLQVGRAHFRTWIQPAHLVRIENGVAVIGVPDATTKAGLESQYMTLFRGLLADLLGLELVPRFVIQPGGHHA